MQLKRYVTNWDIRWIKSLLFGDSMNDKSMFKSQV
ncbi:hypothetical protein ACVPOR_04895 [Staphylococcus aureus]